MNIACALLAAGASARFGANKLLHNVDGCPMVEHALRLHAALPYCEKLIVTRADYAPVIALATDYGFRVLYNDQPLRGMGSSAAIAAKALWETGAAGALFAVCDQPYLRRESVERLLQDFLAHQDGIAALAHGWARGNPCVFPRGLLPELAALDGDRGGGAVIARHMDRLFYTQAADALELKDIDAPPEDL
jgi:molybdenum cofactor cytidylyltransferase